MLVGNYDDNFFQCARRMLNKVLTNCGLYNDKIQAGININRHKININRYNLLNYELFFKDILNLELSQEDRELIKSRLKDTSLSSYKNI